MSITDGDIGRIAEDFSRTEFFNLYANVERLAQELDVDNVLMYQDCYRTLHGYKHFCLKDVLKKFNKNTRNSGVRAYAILAEKLINISAPKCLADMVLEYEEAEE